jgi:LacI family transcriptional regulator
MPRLPEAASPAESVISPPQNRVTAMDVARLAGVSQPTVSLVLGGNPQARIAPDTRERVLRAAEELGYRPNLLARGLSQRRSYAIGILVPDLSNPFFADVISGAERVLSRAGYALLVSEASDDSAPSRLEALQSRLIDGVLLDATVAAMIAPSVLDELNVVLVDEPSDRWPNVASDAEAAGRLAAEHLLSLGHQSFAFIGPATTARSIRLRERGFVVALRSSGFMLPSDRLRRAPATAAGGREATRALLAGRRRPTGIFCANDLIAVGALKACSDAGVGVPAQVSVVGCDDIEMARLVTPELTTVEVRARELGARAARLLVQRLEGEQPRRSRPGRVLPVRLVRRASTGEARVA